jgi:hypothetical protein
MVRGAHVILDDFPSEGSTLSQLKLEVAAAEKVLADALAATKRWEPSNMTIEAALSAENGSKRLERVISNKMNEGPGKREFTRTASKVSEARDALDAAAGDALLGDAPSAAKLGSAVAKVNEAQLSLAKAMETAPADIMTELEQVRDALEQASRAVAKAGST